METKTPEQHLNKAIKGDYEDKYWNVDDLGQPEALKAMETYAKQETERLQSENERMRELLKEIELEMKFTQGYNPLMEQIQTLLNPK